MTTQSPVDWEAIRAAYTKRDRPVSAIAKQFGVTAGRIWTRARRSSWEKPNEAPAQPVPEVPVQRKAGSRTKNRKQVKRQLLEVLAMQVERLERRIVSETEMTSADYEREARALNSLVRNFEALDTASQAELPQISKVSRGGRSKTGNAVREVAADDQDTLRRDLAQRLMRLREQLAERG